MTNIDVTNQESFFNEFKLFVGDERTSDSIDAVSNMSSIQFINLSKFECRIIT